MMFCVWFDLCENTKAYVVLMKSCVFFLCRCLIIIDEVKMVLWKCNFLKKYYIVLVMHQQWRHDLRRWETLFIKSTGLQSVKHNARIKQVCFFLILTCRDKTLQKRCV